MADQFDVVLLETNTSSQTVWRITQPNVKQKTTQYPQIKFLPGDSVSIDAGGCVQTGGSGRTWKRYVDPSGPNADRLYHGEIWIPGINNGLQRIKDFAAFHKPVQIPSPLPANLAAGSLVLHLGYEDDGYGDNGYYSHDDGTEDQCKNSTNAYVIISIGHNGTLAADPTTFTGISPATYRCQAAWAFHNFDTSQLSNDSFNDAFGLSWYDYLDPTTWITFYAARGMASGGNCCGMSLLANVGEDQFVVGQLDESFWANYKSQTIASPNVTYSINVAHWKQLSVSFLRGYIGTAFQSPTITAGAIERDLTKQNYNYGLLSIEYNKEGHVLVPLHVAHVGAQIQITVYDSNRPCTSIPDKGTYPTVNIQGNSWSYDMGSDGIWSGSTNNAVSFSGLGYVPYLGPDGWSDLGTNLLGLVKVIFGSGVDVEQVTDNTGKRLFVEGQPNVLDKTEAGLGNQLIKVPMLATNKYGRPRTASPAFSLNHALALTPAMKTQVAQIQSQYEAEYTNSRQIFLAQPKALSSLTFSLSGKGGAQAMRMTVGHQDQFYEMKLSAQAAAVKPTLVISNLASLPDGVSIRSSDATAVKAVVTHGLIAAQSNTVTLQTTGELPVGTEAVKFSLAADKTLQLASTASLGSISVNTQTIDKDANVKAGPVRVVTGKVG